MGFCAFVALPFVIEEDRLIQAKYLLFGLRYKVQIFLAQKRAKKQNLTGIDRLHFHSLSLSSLSTFSIVIPVYP